MHKEVKKFLKQTNEQAEELYVDIKKAIVKYTKNETVSLPVIFAILEQHKDELIHHLQQNQRATIVKKDKKMGDYIG